jgi:chorismate synthase
MTLLRFLTAGESHGPRLTAILEGMTAGLPIAAEAIDHELARRQQSYGSGGRMKIEHDTVAITAGVTAGVTTGAPISLEVANLDYKAWAAKEIPPMTIPRPGHADLTGAIKYGYRDLRPALERASARETTLRVAVGAVCKAYLAQFGITVGGYVTSIGEVEAALPDDLPYTQRFTLAEASEVRCPDPAASEAMRKLIWDVMQARDTLGGVFEIVALGVPPGLGSHVHFDRKLDGRLLAALGSIQAIKGAEIGSAFANARLRGTQVHDEITLESTGAECCARP